MPQRSETAVYLRQRLIVTDPGEMTPERVRAIRVSLGKSPARMAEYLGVAVRTVRSWELRRSPTGSMGLVLALIEAWGQMHVSITEPIQQCREAMSADGVVRRIREEEGLSQPGFARLICMHKGQLANIEAGKSRPSAGASRLLWLVHNRGSRQVLLPRARNPDPSPRYARADASYPSAGVTDLYPTD